MSNLARNTSLGSLMLVLVGVSQFASAAEDKVYYHFLPIDTVVNNVKVNLDTHGINTENLTITADSQGVVNVSGTVASKQETKHIQDLVMSTAGVYAILGDYKLTDDQTL